MHCFKAFLFSMTVLVTATNSGAKGRAFVLGLLSSLFQDEEQL